MQAAQSGGSGAPAMASSRQVAFIKFWEPYAKQASSNIGIPYQWILAQWGMETGYGTQPNMGHNNPGNVGNLGNGWQNYKTPQDFVSAYSTAMLNDFPNLNSNHLLFARTGQTQVAGSTPQQVLNGKNSYAPSITNYGSRVAAQLPTVCAVLGNCPKSWNTGKGSLAANGYGAASKTQTNALVNWLSGAWGGLQKDAMTIALVIALLVLIILLLYRGIIK